MLNTLTIPLSAHKVNLSGV